MDTTVISKEVFKDQFLQLSDQLKEQINPEGFWSGRLSSSALATAVAIVALKVHKEPWAAEKIESGLQWLLNNGNNDGGFGDTPDSKSNVSTSLLCYAAISYCCNDQSSRKEALKNIEKFLKTQHISLESDNVTSSLLNYYGNDLTFSVPILSMLVICGVLDEQACNRIPQLPFEFTLLPGSLYRLFNLQVVSYAIPALVAVGIFIFKKRTRGNFLLRYIRKKSISPAIKKLGETAPESGGFLEAIPLTAFVCMCLIASKTPSDSVVGNGIAFLKKQQRVDGSWPIDTDLSTWVTTLGIKALGPELHQILPTESINSVKKHLLNTQYKHIHPFNGAKPGGWGWTNFSGSVPDADDTPGAILALLQMYEGKNEETEAILNGCRWLISIQNHDGGFPTFCKGWGRLPFDSSSADLTGHAFAALVLSMNLLGDDMPPELCTALCKSAEKALGFLEKVQLPDGSWLPLWFGSQETEDKTNPVYGTAKVSIYLTDCLSSKKLLKPLRVSIKQMLGKAQHYLASQQNDDGSWGASIGLKPSTEETALAVSALAATNENAGIKGLQWLGNESKNNGLGSAPIGLYFATLWYDEALYPLIYYIEALRRFLNR
jgi:squalene-hopene/tetraprenyl-beta-curcumene cyclase